MPIPVATITTVTKYRISDEAEMNATNISFTFDVPIVECRVNVLGTSYDSGTIIDSITRQISDLQTQSVSEVAIQTVADIRQINDGVEITTQVFYTDLYQEGDNRINVYGKSLDGNWSLYGS